MRQWEVDTVESSKAWKEVAGEMSGVGSYTQCVDVGGYRESMEVSKESRGT